MGPNEITRRLFEAEVQGTESYLLLFMLNYITTFSVLHATACHRDGLVAVLYTLRISANHDAKKNTHNHASL